MPRLQRWVLVSWSLTPDCLFLSHQGASGFGFALLVEEVVLEQGRVCRGQWRECPIHRMERKGRYRLPFSAVEVTFVSSFRFWVCVKWARSPLAESIVFIYVMVLRV